MQLEVYLGEMGFFIAPAGWAKVEAERRRVSRYYASRYKARQECEAMNRGQLDERDEFDMGGV